MKYISTRGGIDPISFNQAVMMGLASDGGLLLPAVIPSFSAAEIEELADLSYSQLALNVFSRFIGDDIPQNDLRRLIETSYATFSTKTVVPLEKVGDLYIQELSKRLAVKESTIILQLRNTKRGTAELQREDNKAMDKDLAERILLQLMLIKKEVIHNIRDEAVIEDFNNHLYKEIASFILSVFDKEGDVDPAKIMNQLEDESSKELVSLLLMQDGSIVDIEKTFRNCIYKVRMNKIKKDCLKEASEKLIDLRNGNSKLDKIEKRP